MSITTPTNPADAVRLVPMQFAHLADPLNVNRCGLPQKLRLCSMMHRSCDWLLLRCSKRGT